MEEIIRKTYILYIEYILNSGRLFNTLPQQVLGAGKSWEKQNDVCQQ